MGFPDCTECPHPEQFLCSWLCNVFDNDTLSSTIVIECAHRTPSHPPPAGAPLRSLIAWIFNFQENVAILCLAREKGPLKYNGNTISVYLDFSAEVQRTSIATVKDRLRTEGLQYAMLFPANLWIIQNGKVQFYTNPKEAMAWLNDRFGAAPKHRRN